MCFALTVAAPCSADFQIFSIYEYLWKCSRVACRRSSAVSPNSTRHWTFSQIPKGFRLKAQGCEARATLGLIGHPSTTPTGLRPFCSWSYTHEDRNPFRVVIGSLFPRVARASQPWALGRNPFGIECD